MLLIEPTGDREELMVDYTKRPSSSAAATTAGGGESRSKVTLTKAAPTVSLRKQGATMSGELRVNLNWNPRPAGAAATGGLLKRLTAAALCVRLM